MGTPLVIILHFVCKLRGSLFSVCVCLCVCGISECVGCGCG